MNYFVRSFRFLRLMGPPSNVTYIIYFVNGKQLNYYPIYGFRCVYQFSLISFRFPLPVYLIPLVYDLTPNPAWALWN